MEVGASHISSPCDLRHPVNDDQEQKLLTRINSSLHRLKFLLKVLTLDGWLDGSHCKAGSHDMRANKEEFQ